MRRTIRRRKGSGAEMGPPPSQAGPGPITRPCQTGLGRPGFSRRRHSPADPLTSRQGRRSKLAGPLWRLLGELGVRSMS